MKVSRLKEIPAAPVLIVRNLFANRHILFQMVLREIKGKFAGSIGGMFWNFVHPLLLLAVYIFVFIYIFKLRVSSGGGAGASALFITAGLFPWLIFAEGLLRGTSSLIENANLIQKTSFPVEILTSKAVIAPFFGNGAAILLLALYRIIFSGATIIIPALPLLIIIQAMFTMGIAFLAAASTVFFRDVLQFVQIAVNFWIYLTPIFYPTSMLPRWARSLMYLNPLYPITDTYQSLFVRGSLPGWNMVALSVIWSTLFFVAGAFIFNKLRYEFADWL